MSPGVSGVGCGRGLDAGHIGFEPDQIIRRHVRPEFGAGLVEREKKQSPVLILVLTSLRARRIVRIDQHIIGREAVKPEREMDYYPIARRRRSVWPKAKPAAETSRGAPRWRRRAIIAHWLPSTSTIRARGMAAPRDEVHHELAATSVLGGPGGRCSLFTIWILIEWR